MSKRLLCLLLFSAVPAFGQVHAGVKVGLPVTDAFATGTVPTLQYFSEAKRYVVGPTFELQLPHRVALEFDALYRRFDYRSISTLVDLIALRSTQANAWEFPVLVKYRTKGKPLVHPFLDAGLVFNRVSGVTKFTNTLVTGVSRVVTGQESPSELRHSVTAGLVLGGGVDIRALVIHIQPELRFTRWGSENFQAGSSSALSSQRNQLELLVGINF
jgi:hypothetical protein